MHPTPPRRLSGALLAATGCCLLALPGASAQGSPAPPPPAKINCMPGVHVIVARASEEAPGPGFLRKVAEDVVSKIPGSDFVSVDYPAKLSDYKASQKAGLVAMSALINDYTAACPDGKVVLMGYSQGAHIAADIVCGASEETFDQASAISDDKSSKIAAVVMMGDPSRNATAPFNQGNATKDGVFPRKNIAGCGAMASRMVSYCSAGDMFCDSGNDLGIHLTYADTQGTAATQHHPRLVRRRPLDRQHRAPLLLPLHHHPRQAPLQLAHLCQALLQLLVLRNRALHRALALVPLDRLPLPRRPVGHPRLVLLQPLAHLSQELLLPPARLHRGQPLPAQQLLDPHPDPLPPVPRRLARVPPRLLHQLARLLRRPGELLPLPPPPRLLQPRHQPPVVARHLPGRPRVLATPPGRLFLPATAYHKRQPQALGTRYHQMRTPNSCDDSSRPFFLQSILSLAQPRLQSYSV
ncbi:hypothetical protein RB595_005911 [Gaeumannomyces hyphopodioides]